jgi:tetratricopeptide (TPR) repeat protein
MKSSPPAAADLQRWSEDVARDPASLAFVPLARAYRKQGRRDAALKLCLRGLEHHPTNVDGHALLALLYFESGHRAQAYDEWATVLRLEPEHFEALRGLGFYHLERGDDAAALRSLQRAALIRPRDLTVQEALKLINDQRPTPPEASDPMPWEADDPWQTPDTSIVALPLTDGAAPPGAVHPPEAQRLPPLELLADTGGSAGDGRTAPQMDPTHLFDSMLRGGQILGALLIDAQGLVLAGSLTGAPATKAQTLGAILGGTIEEAVRTSGYLTMGSWQSIMLDADRALLHLAPVREGAILLLAADRNTPAGWMVRSAHQAAVIAERFLEANS